MSQGRVTWETKFRIRRTCLGSVCKEATPGLTTHRSDFEFQSNTFIQSHLCIPTSGKVLLVLHKDISWTIRVERGLKSQIV